MLAAKAGNLPVVRRLIEIDGESPVQLSSAPQLLNVLQIAAEESQLHILYYLLSPPGTGFLTKPLPALKTNKGNNLLHLACAKGAYLTIAWFYKFYPDATLEMLRTPNNTPTSKGVLPERTATLARKVELVKWMQSALPKVTRNLGNPLSLLIEGKLCSVLYQLCAILYLKCILRRFTATSGC